MKTRTMPLIARAAATFGIAVALVAMSVLPAHADAPTPVDPAEVASLTIASGDATLSAGWYFYAGVEAYDSDGADLGNVTAQATLVDSVSADQSDAVHPWNLVVEKAGTHTITATYGTASASITLTVNPGPLSTFAIGGIPDSPVTAGTTLSGLTAEGQDEFGNALGDYTSRVSFDVPGFSASRGESVTGTSVHLTQAGGRTVTAQYDSYVGSATFTVVHAAAAAGSYRWGTLPNQIWVGVAYSYPVESLDRYGNVVAAVKAKLKSSHTADHTAGSRVTFVIKGERTVTATMGSKHLSVRVGAAQDGVVSEFLFAGTAAGHAPHVTVQMFAGASGVQPTGIVRVYFYNHETVHVDVHVTSNRVYTVPMPKLTTAGTWQSNAMYLGSNAYMRSVLSGDYLSQGGSSVLEQVFPADPAGIVLSHVGASFAAPTQFSTFLADKYGNHIRQVDDAVLTASSGAKVDADTVTFPKAGTYTVRSREGGYSTSKSVTVIRSSSFTEFDEIPPIVSGTASTIRVYVSSIQDPSVVPTGSVVLHYGTRTLTRPIVVSNGLGTVDFTLPALRIGSYVLYAGYAGDGGLHSSHTGHKTVEVVSAE